MPIKNHIVFVVDHSGSMSTMREAVVSGFNEQVQTVKSHPHREHVRVGLVTFDSQVRENFIEQDRAVLHEISLEDYVPRGNTAMYDGIAYAIQRLQAVVQDSENDTYLVIVITDGQENSSKWVTQAAVAKQIKQLQATGRWSFVVMGANIDLAYAQAAGVQHGNFRTFIPDSAGMGIAMRSLSHGVGNYMSESSRGLVPDSADFYGTPSN